MISYIFNKKHINNYTLCIIMIKGKIMKWGNSYGLRISKTDFEKLNLGLNQNVTIKIEKRENPLRELFESGLNLKNTREELKKERKALEGKYLK